MTWTERQAPGFSPGATGVMPFLASNFLRIGFLVAFPALSLWLVRAM